MNAKYADPTGLATQAILDGEPVFDLLFQRPESIDGRIGVAGTAGFSIGSPATPYDDSDNSSLGTLGNSMKAGARGTMSTTRQIVPARECGGLDYGSGSAHANMTPPLLVRTYWRPSSS